MKRISVIFLTALAAFLLTGCEPGATNAPANANVTNTNTNATSTAAAPTVGSLMTIERNAFAAWKNKDAKFFDGLMADNFVMNGPEGRVNKAESIKMITENPCTVGDYTLSEERMTPAGPDVAVLTFKFDADVTCDGQKHPSPSIGTTVYVRSNNEWKAAYHNEVPIVKDPASAAAPSATKQPVAQSKSNSAANSNSNMNPAAASDAGTASPMTATLVAQEKLGWEAWMARDRAKLDALTAKELNYVDMFGNVRADKAATLSAWTEAKCEIKSVSVTDGHGVTLSPTASLLLYKGSAEGTCEGRPIGSLLGTSVYVKEGETWKVVYSFQTPS